MLKIDSYNNISVSEYDNFVLVLDLYDGDTPLVISSSQTFIFNVGDDALTKQITSVSVVGDGTNVVTIEMNLKTITGLRAGDYKYDTRIVNQDETEYYYTDPRIFKVLKQVPRS